MSETKDQSNEFSLINRYFKNLTAQQDVVIGIGDDAAILEPTQGHQLALATDSLVCAVHFPEEAKAYQIATRSLCVNLSDMAAMGATPKWFTLALTIPKSFATTNWLEEFSQGLADIANQYNVSLVGGDTTAGPLTISITVAGELPAGESLCRGGAQVGDTIYVSGTLGDGAAGLYELTHNPKTISERLLQRFYAPQPQIDLGKGLRDYATACIDISDGLIADLGHICKASGLGAQIRSDLLPVHSELKVNHSNHFQQWVLTGGDDYQLCFTVPEAKQPAFESWALKNNILVSKIGNMTELQHNQDSILLDSKPVSVGYGGYTHFK
ncbi:MAG: thiamine-phosphate kinase [Porticoccaceae bacterium]